MTFPQLLGEIAKYPAGVWEELRRVTWPTPKAVWNALLIITVIVSIAIAFVGAIDVAFSQMIARLL